MQRACLYIRVSTEEQAIRGYSQRTQQDRLIKFCLAHNIEILNSVYEDHSAKTFDRPQWSGMMYALRRNKLLRPNLLFTKWDRFSRNAGDAYYMIAQLKSLGITPQATDQELDLSIPENKIILGVYLATSEAENDRRSVNVRQGLHKANLEGRWTAHVPIGYKAKMTADHKRNLIPSEPQASFILKAFTQLAEGHCTVQFVYQQAVAAGLSCSISNFRRILRSPVYYGKIAIPAFEGKAPHLVDGLQKPIITEQLFDLVQRILDHKNPVSRIRGNHKDEFLYLRSFFYCPNCGKLLTGSGSRSKSGLKYYYYHCSSICGFRTRADKTNMLFVERLEKLHVDNAYLSLYREIVRQVRKDLCADKIISRQTTAATINRLVERIVHAKELLLNGSIEEEDFQL
ncbi:recombinase family protein [Dyadobacter sp. CY312]|uniref:recombinase family protein n=1 Tax=Dyadobacter sp. CY312 TaxID=2907303 RepID=UPI001F3B45A2|nr:recombinase family protein [Dyadobacter sp. CY312]MCE7044051.1 recombinase family protein [Dyadobacter sp. CY312]